MYQDSRTIPVVYHNLSKYDGHFLITEVAKIFDGNIRLIPLTKETYISFTVASENPFTSKNKPRIQFKFIDSLRFMASSLDKLASNLTEYPKVKKCSPVSQTQKCNLLLRKGVFPYDWFDSFEKLMYTELPEKKYFFNSLTNSHISDDDYLHAQKVWKEMEIKTFAEYVQLYMKIDILLLADIFEKFCENSLNAYRLDPCHYYTAPGLSWDAMLKITKIQLNLLTDIDMAMFIESGIRGGISQCSNRYSKANNKYMSDHNPNEPSKYIMYYDANNLYGYAMEQYLPTGGFRWLNQHELEQFNVTNISDENQKGYILEVDLEYPEYLHDDHNDLPFCPVHEAPSGGKQRKLLTTLTNKEKYVVHYRYLKHAVKNGLKITKLHKVLEFDQSNWLQIYIRKNTNLRANAKNEFKKNFYKLMNNSVYSKTMENVRKRIDVKLKNKWDGRYGIESLVSKPNFKSCTIFSDNLVAVESSLTEIKINKPIYIGLCVLDISKCLMYDFHYQYMKKKFAKNCKLLYTDTDSLIYEITCDDIYESMKQDIHLFDTSDYSEDNIYGIPLVNKKIVGLMKDECNGKIVTEFAGLRSKMYAIRVYGMDFIKKIRGIKMCVVKNTIDFEHYKDCLFNGTLELREQTTLTSKFHKIYTEKQTKLALSPYDDKRYLLANNTDT